MRWYYVVWEWEDRHLGEFLILPDLSTVSLQKAMERFDDHPTLTFIIQLEKVGGGEG